MNHKINQNVLVKVEVQKSGRKSVLTKEPRKSSTVIEQLFKIVLINETCQLYSIVIDDDMLGCYLDTFHVAHCNLDKKYLGKKFVEINDSLILKVVK